MRVLTSHQINKLNLHINVVAYGEQNNAGAYTHYRISGYNLDSNPAAPKAGPGTVDLFFQNGNPADGANGITHEALLAILIDRLESFQASAFAHERNANALRALYTARTELLARTQERIAAGIEGQRVP